MSTKHLYPLRDFSLGTNDKDSANLIPDNALIEAKNAILGKGSVSKRHGFVRYSNQLGFPITRLYDFYRSDGTKEFVAVANKTLYKDTNGVLSSMPTYHFLEIDKCDDTWNEYVDSDVTVTVDTADKQSGNGSVKLTVSATASAGDLLVTEAIPPKDLSQATNVLVWIRSSVTTAAGDLQLLLDNTANCASPVYTISIPALTANIWKWVEVPINGATTGSDAIISVGLKYVTDLGACEIKVDHIEARIPITLTTDDTKMITYKSRTIEDRVLIADKGKLKVYASEDQAVIQVRPRITTTAEQTDPGLNDLSNLTNFRALAIKKDRIFAAAHPTVKNRISFCHHDSILGFAVYDYWPATFFFDVAVEDNDEIVELKTFRDAIIVLCKRSIWILKGDGRTITDYELHKINVPSGCIAPNSVQIVGNDMFYLSDDHVYRLYSTEESFVSATIISMNVENTLKGISRSDKAKASGAYYQNKYYLSFPNGTCLVFDIQQQSWVTWTNVQANSFLDRDGVFYFSSNTGFIYKFDENIFNDDGVAIPFSITTKNFDFGTEVQDKKYRRLWAIAKQFDALSSTFNIKAKIDYVEINLTDIKTDQSLVWDEGNWDEGLWDFIGVVRNELRLKERGKNIQFIITNSVLNEAVTLYGLVIEYKLKRP